MNFLELVIDWDLNCITRNKISVRISEQEKIIFHTLLDHPDELLDRKQLTQAVWGDRAPFINDLYLTQLISRLRRSLAPIGLSGNIITSARRGYKFLDRDLQSAPSAGPAALASPVESLTMDLDNLLVSNGKISVRVTRLEGCILAAFIEHPDRVLSREALISTIWKSTEKPYHENLAQLISKARKIVSPLSGGDIKSVPNVGYKYCVSKQTQ